MGVTVFKKSFLSSVFSGMRVIFFTLVVICVVIVGVAQAAGSNREEGKRLLEEAIIRAAVSSYAVHGYYPESLDYIAENYAIHIDSRYVVHYEVFGRNILPDIRVFEL